MSGDAYARRFDPETSHEAANAVDADSVEGLVVRILDESKYDGLSMESVADITGVCINTISPRFRPLANKGLIFDTGRKRKNKTGKNAIIWVTRKYYVPLEEDQPTFEELHKSIMRERYNDEE